MLKAANFTCSVTKNKTIWNSRLFSFSSPYNNKSNNKIHLKKDSSNELKEKNKNYPTYRTRANAKSNLILTDYLKEALIGLTLGDVSLEKATKNSNIRLRFEQGLIHSEYLHFLYDLFKIYTLSSPKITNRKPDKRTGKIYNSLIFKTRMLPCFNYLWDLFYKDNKKVVPSNISSLLTEVSLAFWIMDDGGVGSGDTLHLNTDSFTEEEVNLLLETLNEKFKLKCRKSLKKMNQWRIVIPKSQVNTVAELVIKHMHPSMFYKIGRK